MSNNESTRGGGASAGGEVGGGGGGKSILGGAGQPTKVRASFVGPIFPAPLDENGALRDQSLRRGLGRAHLVAVVFPFQAESEQLDAARAELDKQLGQPFFTAYIYPNPFLNEEEGEVLFEVGGGGGGKSILGGVTQSITYLGQFRAVLPDVGSGEQEDPGSNPPPGG
jgi:hypothetical protein